MGCCTTTTSKHKQMSSFKPIELDLLLLMFTDLANRSKSNKVQKQTFLTFFHLNGLWGQQIFYKFNKSRSNSLDFQEFRDGIDVLLKGSYENRIYCLFEFYDIEKKGGVSYESLLKMLYSYTKEELIQIIDDEKFISDMNDQERCYHFGKGKELDAEKNVVDIEAELEQEQNDIKREMRLKGKKISENYGAKRIEEEQNSQNAESSIRLKIDVDRQKDLKPWKKDLQKQTPIDPFNATGLILPQIQVNKQISCKVLFYNNNKFKTKVTSNITILVKKYAAFLFKQQNLDKNKDLLTFLQFQQLIKKHKRIYSEYYQSFHDYIWQVNQENIPDFIKNKSQMQSQCLFVEAVLHKPSKTSTRYIKLYQTTVFIFKSKEQIMPIHIINLEGLFVQQTSTSKNFGFIIKHKDGIYPQHSYLFKTKALQQQWIKSLSMFQKQAIYNKYISLERIGSGKFSIVYKGKGRKCDTPVAIKVIEKFKLNQNEKDVIDQEARIMELLCHPSIVNHIDMYEYKNTKYIVTELMGDGDLHSYVKKKNFLDEFEAAVIIYDILEGLSYLHKSGIIHRDLKSENIMLKLKQDKNQIQKAKIIDFGFAVYKDKLSNRPQQQRFVGTPNFVAPEILLTEEYNEKVDLFSLGVIMYFALTGELPFASIFGEMDVIKKTIQLDIYYDESHWRHVSPDAKDLINKLLVKKEERIGVQDALKHPWIKDRSELKDRKNKNRKSKFI